MLGLKLTTDPRWVNLAEMNLEEILTDHAYCELKAATSCISLIQQYPRKLELVKELTPIVTEEWGHFRMVLDKLNKYNLQLGDQRKDEYVNALLSYQKHGGSKDDRLVERLLTCALIEARSCERFRLLSVSLKDSNLAEFYHKLMASEAGHYKMFLKLAILYGRSEEIVMERWQEFLIKEVEIMKSIKLRGDRIH